MFPRIFEKFFLLFSLSQERHFFATLSKIGLQQFIKLYSCS